MTSRKYAKTLTEVTCDAKLWRFIHTFFLIKIEHYIYS